MHDEAASRFWAVDDRLATPLVVLLVDRYGPESLNWLPETWVREVGQDCRVALPDGNLSRLAAGALVLTQPHRFRDDWRAFELACRMMNSTGDRQQTGEYADLADVTWGVLESTLLHPTDRPYSNEVKAYVGVVLDEAGVHEPPELLQSLGVVKGARPRLVEDPADPDVAAQEAGRQAHRREVDETLEQNAGRLIQQFRELGGVLREGKTDKYVEKLRKIFPSS